MSAIRSTQNTPFVMRPDTSPVEAPTPVSNPSDTLDPSTVPARPTRPTRTKPPVPTIEQRILQKLKEYGTKANDAARTAALNAARVGLELLDKAQSAIAGILERVRH